MIGSIIGDILGSNYEYRDFDINSIDLLNNESKFTDDTILTIAIADCLINNKDYSKTIKEYALEYPDAGYGSRFKEWLNSETLEPYNSFGNGGAMRVASIPLLFNNFDDVMLKAKESSIPTHDHIDGIIGSQAIAITIHLAKNGFSKEEIKLQIEQLFDYKLDDYVITEKFNCLANITVPNAIVAFLKSNNFEESIINSIKIKGDTDTVACMAGGISEAYYGLDSIPEIYINLMKEKLPPKYLDIVEKVYEIESLEKTKNNIDR